jgi:hypothetical protein
MSQLAEIKQAIIQLKQMEKALTVEEQNCFLENAAVDVGRCFQWTEKRFVKILDVPQVQYRMYGEALFRIHFPALWVNHDEYVPFKFDTVRWNDSTHRPQWNQHAMEITQEEFNAEAELAWQSLCQRLTSNASLESVFHEQIHYLNIYKGMDDFDAE